ncbi:MULTISPECIES: aldehyde dehydrogenase family protein [unclassified Micromonospora]|uniref:aldehyde dehydrogenase family protein n=1 Tax=unclassified Micromonospora TaxID=2617518 RepID=UPI0022B6E3DC|nr:MULTISPECIES: aldehyde dehydrogenase family protein [unclassified Micromonospora]MCZ7421941.1 aldehyde dehydrogenase family protein [Verrucosispora sp. WMMA2121]WBB93324.1 aldehyde dehydrogenase family protein [Verrucosispora sp. WMMC514]
MGAPVLRLKRNGSRRMLVDERDQEIPLARVTARCHDLVAELRHCGVTENDRVVFSAANSAEFVVGLFALMELGVSIALVDRGATQSDCAALVGESGARWFLSDHPSLDAAFDRVRVGWLQLGELTAERVEPVATGTSGLSFDRWRNRRDALIVWTSGSSGAPKGIVRSGASVLDNVERTQARMGYHADDVLLPLLPFTHQYGLSMLLLWRQVGATLTVLPSTRVDRALEVIERRNVTAVDAVPAAYRAMLRLTDGNRLAGRRFSSVRLWCVGGEPLRDDLRRQFAEWAGQPLLDGYGSSEAGNIALATVELPEHSGPPLDGVTVEILDEAGARVEPGTVGEVVVRTPDIMVGLLEPGGRVRPVHRPAHHTQDVGFVDERGNIRVLGRKSAVHRFGHTLYPDVIADKVSDCGVPVRVVPVEDPARDTQLVFVVADTEGRPAAHWRRVLGRRLAEYERPNRVVVLDAFPLLNNGKVDAQALTDVAASAVALNGVKGVLPVGHPNEAATDVSTIPFPDRAARLADLAAMLRRRRSEVIDLLTEVSNYKTAYGEVDAAIAALEGAVDEVTRYAPGPVKQIGVLMPSNIPLYSYILYLVIPSLYSERVVFRPSRRIEDQVRKLHSMMADEHRLPIVLDEADQREFLENEGGRSDVLVFTGTYNNAEKIRSGLRKDQLFLYFGQGVNPFIVGPDANIPEAVDGLLRVRMLNSGQDCFGPDVVFVHTSISAQFCNLLCRRVSALRFGRYDDPTAEYGAMFYPDAFDASLSYLLKNREYLAAGGQVNLADNHLHATVLIRPADTALNPPELFAPIFSVVPFTSADWLHKAIDHPYFEERAMAATVYGSMPETVEILRRRHTVSVNETLIEVDNGNAPFGGTGIRANYAAIGRKRTAEPLLLSKAVADHLGGRDRRGDV